MNKQKGFTFVELVFILVIVLGGISYVTNIVKLAGLDFEPSYKAEVIRTVGVFVPPVGVIVGYMKIEDKRSK